MADFIPDGFLSLKAAVDVTGRHFSGSDWTGKEINQLRQPQPKRTSRRLETAVESLRNHIISGRVLPKALADNGQWFEVPSDRWASRDGRAVFNHGLLICDFRGALNAQRDGSFNRRILVPKRELEAALRRKAPRSLRRAPRRFVEADVRPWYRDYVKQCEDAGRTSSRDEDLLEARKALGDGVPREFLRKVRQEIAPPTWTRKGRRKTPQETGD